MKRRKFLLAGGAVLTAGAGLAAYGRFVEPGRVQFTHHDTGLDIPLFAQISDLHLRKLGDVHDDIIEEIRRRAPAFIVFTGDSIDRAEDMPRLQELLQQLPPIPKFAILGNWEYWGRVDIAALRKAFAGANGRLLINESTIAGDVTLCGLDDYLAGNPDIVRAAQNAGRHTDGSGARILLAHCPVHRDQKSVAEARFDLVLSGHTHGGQVRPFGVALVTPQGSGPYVSGW